MKWNPDGKKKELWEQDKNIVQKTLINSKIWLRKFQRETKGLGILFLVFIGVMVILQMLSPFLGMWAGDAFKSESEKRIERQAYCFKYGCIDGV